MVPPTIATPHEVAFARSVLAGLGSSPKSLEARWLYDAVGAKLFEAITKLDHYYLTRTEASLIEAHAGDIADALGTGVTIVEPGSGEAVKVRPILEALGKRAAGYVPIDIAADQLAEVTRELTALYPGLAVTGIAADFFRPFTMERPDNAVIFFPGSTVGNMEPDAAIAFFRRLMDATGARRFLIGFDLVKDPAVLEAAYDDPAGVTAAFEKNVLQRINRELFGTFDLSKFDYRAEFNRETASVEMRLISREAQTVEVAGNAIRFDRGETIRTEESRKYTVERFADFARGADLAPVATWTDDKGYYAVMLLETASAHA